ncbi:arsenate reductase (glutaredoxin) [Umboniibacter marinipuniceus]|uniref:Arsenate reductase n=1 Tax=Umboniibacter marinipuniceus TaxID=569599 RepID=A0A3M0A100_9GAMM|nr:arsenate reductase (glutaredoxin) [Umboniibacter marinipuniceus]RMA78811.1 arsenate reductase [Umboniibacter marinipuniceus]
MTTIYHNPRCSKSRQTLELLTNEGINVNVVRYLDTPPSREQLSDLLNQLGYSAHQLLRKGEAIYKSLGLSADTADAELLAAMVENPILIERPIVSHNGRAMIGRPPEQVLELFK